MAEEQRKGTPVQTKPLSWRAAEYEHTDKDTVWYIAVCGVAALLLIFAVWQRNFFFGIFIVLAAVIVIVLNRRRPRTVDFSIDDNGVAIGTVRYSYEGFEWFAVQVRPGRLDMLTFRRKSSVNPYVHIPVDSVHAAKAQEFLREKLTEGEYEESLIDALAHLVGL
jgi:hypothetical protein